MEMLPVAPYHGAAHRPREFALVARKVCRQFYIGLGLRAGLALLGFGFFALGSRLGRYHFLNLPIEGIGLLLLLRKFLLIGRLVFLQRIHNALLRLLVRFQRFKIRLTLRQNHPVACLETVQLRLLLLQGSLFVFDGLGLGPKTARNALHIGCPSQCLP